MFFNRIVYNRYENGTREIPISYLIKLSNLYNVSIDYIVENKKTILVGEKVKKGDVLATIYYNKCLPEIKIDDIYKIDWKNVLKIWFYVIIIL